MADIAAIVQAIATELGGDQATPEEDGTYTLPVAEDGEVVALVTIYADEVEDGPAKGQGILMVRAIAGELDESIETFLLEDAGSTWFARAYLEQESEEARPEIILEAGLPLDGLSAKIAAQAVVEVVDLALQAEDYVLPEDEDEA